MLNKIQNYQPGRLISLDVYRGIVMIFLIAESASVYIALSDLNRGHTWAAALIRQFFHHPWNGLRFWDLIQPFFMFIVGVAMPFSLKKRLQADTAWGAVWPHIVQRCLWLFLFGIGLHCFYQQRLVWELWNVLTQLSFTILLAFLLIRIPLGRQLFVSALLLITSEIAFTGIWSGGIVGTISNFGSNQ